jgi:hypothetical protein
MNITKGEYIKACETIDLYKAQQAPKTKQVSILYEAEVSVCIRVPAEMTTEEIKEEFEDGYYDYDNKLEDFPRTDLKKFKELIVSGVEIELD